MDKLTANGHLKELLDRADAEPDPRSTPAHQAAARAVREVEDTTRPWIVANEVFVVDRG